MINKSKIKVVKRSEAASIKAVKTRKKSTARTAARQMVSTVTDWVTDLKQRKSDETKAAFDLLFSDKRRASES